MDPTHVIQFGHTTGEFTPQGSDIIWNLFQYHQDGSATSYVGVMSTRDLSEENVKIIGSNKDLIQWRGRPVI